MQKIITTSLIDFLTLEKLHSGPILGPKKIFNTNYYCIQFSAFILPVTLCKELEKYQVLIFGKI